MSGDSLARSIAQTSSHPVSSRREADYDAYLAAVMASERGQAFLAEHARRNRMVDTSQVLAAIGRVEATLANQRQDDTLAAVRGNVAGMSQTIALAKADIAHLGMDDQRLGHLAAATAGLDSIVTASRAATSSILAAAEQIQEIVWRLREAGLDMRSCDALDAKAREVSSACSIHDLMDRRVGKAFALLHDLETHIAATAEGLGIAAPAQAERAQGSAESYDRRPAENPAGRKTPDAEAAPAPVANPPSVPADVRRRDATLSDIARVMSGLLPAAVAEASGSAAQAKASDRADDTQATAGPRAVRPDLPARGMGPDRFAAPRLQGPSLQERSLQTRSLEAQALEARGFQGRKPEATTAAAATPSSIAVDDFNGFIETWPHASSAIEGETEDDAAHEPYVIPARAPAVAATPARMIAADTLSSALDSLVTRAMGLDRLVVDSVATAFANSTSPAAPREDAAKAVPAAVETLPFISKAEQTQTLREAIAQLQAQRMAEAAQTAATTDDAKATSTAEAAQAAAGDAPRERSASDARDDTKTIQRAPVTNAAASPPAQDAAMVHANDDRANAAADHVAETSSTTATNTSRLERGADTSATRASAYALALGTADLDDFLFEQPPAAARHLHHEDTPDAAMRDESVIGTPAQAQSFAQLPDTSIPWATSAEPHHPAPVTAHEPDATASNGDRSARPHAEPDESQSAASGLSHMPVRADPLARLRALSGDETIALFS